MQPSAILDCGHCARAIDSGNRGDVPAVSLARGDIAVSGAVPSCWGQSARGGGASLLSFATRNHFALLEDSLVDRRCQGADRWAFAAAGDRGARVTAYRRRGGDAGGNDDGEQHNQPRIRD